MTPRTIVMDYDPRKEPPPSAARGAIPVAEDGYVFDSKAEHRHYRDLKAMQAGGLITELTVHPRYKFYVNEQWVGSYIADFSFRDATGARRVQDVKGGPPTAVFSLKRRLMAALFGVQVEIVPASR